MDARTARHAAEMILSFQYLCRHLRPPAVAAIIAWIGGRLWIEAILKIQVCPLETAVVKHKFVGNEWFFPLITQHEDETFGPPLLNRFEHVAVGA